MKPYQLVLLIYILVFLVGVFAENYLDSQPTTFNESKFEPVNPNKEFEEGDNPILIWAIVITLLVLGYYIYRYFIKQEDSDLDI